MPGARSLGNARKQAKVVGLLRFQAAAVTKLTLRAMSIEDEVGQLRTGQQRGDSFNVFSDFASEH
jgi:hypothetical protein